MKKVFFYLVLSIGAFAFIYPFIWMISASLSSHMGYAATLGLIFALLILAVVIVQKKFIERE